MSTRTNTTVDLITIRDGLDAESLSKYLGIGYDAALALMGAEIPATTIGRSLICEKRDVDAWVRIQKQNGRDASPSRRSRYKGVYPSGRDQWRAAIRVDGENVYLGRFRSEVAAARAYDDAAVKHGRKRSSLNFPHSKRHTAK